MLVLPIDTRHFLAAVTVADEGSVSRAAIKLKISQSAASKQILALEDYVGHELFTRGHRRLQATAAGEVFVQNARFALEMQERAVQLSREAYIESKAIVHLGKSPYIDPFLISALTTIQRSSFPNMRLDVQSNFSRELCQQVLAGVLDMALVTGEDADPRLSLLEISTTPFYVLAPIDHEVAQRNVISPEDLHGNIWIRFSRHVHPDLYDRFTSVIERNRIKPAAVHHVTTAEEAAQLVLEEDGMAMITQHGAWRVLRRGLTMRPFASEELKITTSLAVRSGECSPVVNRFLREVGKELCSPGKLRSHTDAIHLSRGIFSQSFDYGSTSLLRMVRNQLG